MAKLLYVTPRAAEPPRGGRALLSQLHRCALVSLLGGELGIHELEPAPPSGPTSMLRALGGAIDGVSRSAESRLLKRMADAGITKVFLDGSNLGRLGRTIKRAYPDVAVLTFFHNVEALFFRGALRERPGPRALGVLVANTAAERLAVRFSDRLICLNDRDSDALKQRYGRAATDLLPMAIADERAEDAGSGDEPGEAGYLLFVGGGFYANRAGITWFARSVAPRIARRTLVVGRDLEALGGEIARHANVKLIGEVGALGPWYRNAAAVIAPIFDGSGMKTKVAEALMHGKMVIGTREAFTGYEQLGRPIGPLCDAPDAFVNAIEALDLNPPPPFDGALRLLYERHHSYDALRRRLRTILGQEGSE